MFFSHLRINIRWRCSEAPLLYLQDIIDKFNYFPPAGNTSLTSCYHLVKVILFTALDDLSPQLKEVKSEKNERIHETIKRLNVLLQLEQAPLAWR